MEEFPEMCELYRLKDCMYIHLGEERDTVLMHTGLGKDPIVEMSMVREWRTSVIVDIERDSLAINMGVTRPTIAPELHISLDRLENMGDTDVEVIHGTSYHWGIVYAVRIFDYVVVTSKEYTDVKSLIDMFKKPFRRQGHRVQCNDF